MPAPVASNAQVSPSIVVKGSPAALTFDCNDSDGHTITAAEWYVGADPGQGLGEACTLGPGTDSRQASGTIDTTGWRATEYPGLNYTIRCRCFDDTDGWGATSSVVLGVASSIPDTPRRHGALMSSVGRIGGLGGA